MNTITTEPKAILNLRKYYKDCLQSHESSYSCSLIAAILSNIIDNEITAKNISFAIIYEKAGNYVCMDGIGSESTVQERPIDSIEKGVQYFKNTEDKKNQLVSTCNYHRLIGSWLDENNEVRGKIYYSFCIYGFDEIQTIYINSFEEAYYEWTKEIIPQVANSLVEYKEIGKKRKNIINKICKRTEIIFEEKMLNFYGIDLNIITDISGSYYEGAKCNSALVFKIGSSRPKGVFFSEKDHVEVKKENIKNLRKILEMCQGNQFILVERDSNLKWLAKGLCDNIFDTNDILFRITDHMFWEMQIGNRFSVCYKYGKYKISQATKKLKEFKEIYNKAFCKKANHYLENVFDLAMAQPHGTCIIILDNGAVKGEINRLLASSSGIAVTPEIQIPKRFILGITSIDGAVIMDSCGKCYAIGTILDGSAEIVGERAHGARHNSVMRYIKTKHNEGIKGIGIIFSEDRTIKLISTEDDWEAPEHECE